MGGKEHRSIHTVARAVTINKFILINYICFIIKLLIQYLPLTYYTCNALFSNNLCFNKRYL